MHMEQDKHTYRARLDFLYQSIAMYAATIVIYLIARSMFARRAFPTLWQDPLLLLLCAITLASIVGLLYNLYMRRQIRVHADRLEFSSRARLRTIAKSEVTYVQFGDVRAAMNRRGIRFVKIGLRDRRRPVRIRLTNFEHSKRLLGELKE